MQDTINYQRIEQAIQYLSHNFRAQPTLEEVAAEVALSPHHFQRLFKEWAGISPKKFLQYITTDFLKEKLQETRNLIEAAEMAGLSSQSRVYDLFVSIEAMTPQEYKSGGQNLQIDYGFHHTPFGLCLLATTERGICKLSFVEEAEKEIELAGLRAHWPYATLVHNQPLSSSIIPKIFPLADSERVRLPLLVQGTNFQLKVWEALLQIPPGALTTYQQIAEMIGNPKAVRAVGTAVGKNPIGYIIPCHRVIRKEGKLGGYHWGTNRKRAIIGWEMGKVEAA